VATNIYFNNQRANPEQALLEDLIIESIKNHGIDVYYLPRQSQSVTDPLFGDDPAKTFRIAVKVEVYMENYTGYEGADEFFSKFGLNSQGNSKLCISRRTFEKYIGNVFDDHHVPKEGDLLYLPTHYKLMEIKFVQDEKNFFQLGRDSINPYMYGLSVEAFKYNGELLQTGIEEIDGIAEKQAVTVAHTLNLNGTGSFTQFEWVYQGATLQTATAKGIVSSFNKPNGTLVLRNIMGEFSTVSAIKGDSSGASWTLLNPADTMANFNREMNIEDNVRVQQEANNVLDLSEFNPFGIP